MFNFNNKIIRLLIMLFMASTTAQATDIIVGAGSGILWSGAPFSHDLTIELDKSKKEGAASRTHPSEPLLTFSNHLINSCIKRSTHEIHGFSGIKIADGLILLPRGTVYIKYYAHNNTWQTISGSFGSPGAKIVDTNGVNLTDLSTLSCVYPVLNGAYNIVDFIFARFHPTDNLLRREVITSGDWIIVGDGSQKTGRYDIPPYYAVSELRAVDDIGNFNFIRRKNELSLNQAFIYVSNINCQINTPTTIDFGRRSPQAQPFNEIAQVRVPFAVNCTQQPKYYSANIAVYFTALSGHYQGDVHHLALNQPGGYITGEFAGLNQSGACNASSGIAFDNSRIMLGAITASEPTKTLTHQLTWRLCEGSTPPDPGPITASAEVNVVVN